MSIQSEDAYELPVDFEVTKASNSELKETEKLLEGIKENKPIKLERDAVIFWQTADMTAQS